MNTVEIVNKKVKKFFHQYQPVNFGKKELLIRYDEVKTDSIYFIEEGFVSQSIVTEEGEKMIANIFRPYSYFPMIHVLNNIPNRYEFRALSPVKVWKAPANEALSFVQKNTDVMYDLSRRFGLGIDRLMLMIKHLRFEQAHERIYGLMSLLGLRFGRSIKGYSVIDFPFTHKDIASYTGLTRETISREFSKLVKDKLIFKREDKIYVKRSDGNDFYQSIY